MSYNKISLLNSYSNLDELNELQIVNRRDLLKEVTKSLNNSYLIFKLSEKENLQNLISQKNANYFEKIDTMKTLPSITWTHTVLRGSYEMKKGYMIEGKFDNSPYFYLLYSNGEEVIFYLLRNTFNTENKDITKKLKPSFIEQICNKFTLDLFKSQNFKNMKSFILFKINLELNFFDNLVQIFSQSMIVYLSNFEKIEKLIEDLYNSEKENLQQKEFESLGAFKFLKELGHHFKKNEKDKILEKISQILNMSKYALSERELEVLKYRYSLSENDQSLGKTETLEEVSNKYGVTRERIRQIERIAISKLKILLNNQLDTEHESKSIKKFCESYTADYKNNTDGLRKIYKYFLSEGIYFKGQVVLNGKSWLSEVISKFALRDIVAKKYINYIFKEEQDKNQLKKNKNELKKIESILTQSIDVLNLSNNSKTTLINNGLYNLDLLINYGKSNLNNLKGIEPESVVEIRNELNSYIKNLTNRPTVNYLNLNDFNFSLRILNVFDQQGINSVSDLTKLTEDDLFKFPNLGISSINEIISKLNKEGINLSN